jgi:hypothetical protein
MPDGKMRRLWIVMPLALVALTAVAVLAFRDGLGPFQHADISQPRIYAYRDWQSVGVQLVPGDVVHIRARGTWLYTPEEYHGPGGHARYPAPTFYPIPHVPGGILIGRIGESGQPFVVGRGQTRSVGQYGLLYLRINDDILSDNEGYVTVEVAVEREEETP